MDVLHKLKISARSATSITCGIADNFEALAEALNSQCPFRLNASGEIVRDDRHNAPGGIRHPAVELREARFIASLDRNGWDLFGDYQNPRQLTAAEYSEYLRSFKQKTDALFDAGYLLDRGRDRLHRHAQLKLNNTYTLNYREGLVYRN